MKAAAIPAGSRCLLLRLLGAAGCAALSLSQLVADPGFKLGDQEYLMEKAKTHWAFQPVHRPLVPEVDKAPRGIHPIDAFVWSKLEEEGLAPSPEADPRTLMRRLFFDLTGLPPGAEEVDAFAADYSESAYRELIESLLASPDYGERWGRHWLDVARYADSKGYIPGNVEERYPYAYTYRDWVVRAFNRDMPFDEFILKQIAADRLADDPDPMEMAALGFLTVGARFLNRTHEIIDDRIDVVTRGMLGVTVSCARCHNHKFDPFSIEDYYSLYGIFSSSREPEEPPLLTETPEKTPGYLEFEKQLKAIETEASAYLGRIHGELRSEEKIVAYLRLLARKRGASKRELMAFAGEEKLFPMIAVRWSDAMESLGREANPVFGMWHALAAIPEDRFASAARETIDRVAGDAARPMNRIVIDAFRSDPPKTFEDVVTRYAAVLISAAGENAHADPDREFLRQVLAHPAGPTGFPLSEMRQYVDRAARDNYDKIVAKGERLKAESPHAPPRAMALVDVEKPADARVFERGNPGSPGETVPRRFLAALDAGDLKPFQEGSGRLELARKIASQENPLTARVMVNRIWAWHFGQSLVATPSDFGLRTEKPVQADLLDYLAARFMDDGWSIKALHRLILTSATYRQRSDVVEASARVDPENQLLWRMPRRRLELEAMRDSLLEVAGELDATTGGKPVSLEGGSASHRRTIYGIVDRQNLPELLRTFDFATPDLHCPERAETTVPQQALFLMNSPFVQERAAAIVAASGFAECQSPDAKVRYLYRRILSRDPEPEEVKIALAFAESPQQWRQFSQVLLASNEFAFVD